MLSFSNSHKRRDTRTYTHVNKKYFPLSPQDHLRKLEDDDADEDYRLECHTKCVEKAKRHSDVGEIAEAVVLLKKAQEFVFVNKIQRRIVRMEVSRLHRPERGDNIVRESLGSRNGGTGRKNSTAGKRERREADFRELLCAASANEYKTTLVLWL